ncbi:MAG TPA: SDR family NAD(P)-dependent oxidoreductase [Chitinophagaceae bacterium]|nr:SDR family NAD(P)-dependent oxidoreductase [Chitinophagaceae bacterium]
MNKQQVWLVTGASKGLGRALVQKLLADGFAVAATSRSREALEKAVGEHPQFLPLALDLMNEGAVQEAMGTILERFGRLDVVVNNAGYGLVGAVEELSDAEVRQNFEVNVFGSLNIIRHALPYLRSQKSGHIFNISSVGGFSGGFPAFGIYCATKFAVNGFTESLSHEIAPFGLHATVVMPGYFRTNFLDAGSLVTPARQLEEYTNVRRMQQVHQEDIHNNQPGDPDKAAEVLIRVAGLEQPPLHLFLGADAYGIAEQKIELVQREMEAHRALATATGFEAVPA